MTEHGDEDPVLIAWIDDDAADLLAVAESEVPPRFPSIGRFIDAVAG